MEYIKKLWNISDNFYDSLDRLKKDVSLFVKKDATLLTLSMSLIQCKNNND